MLAAIASAPITELNQRTLISLSPDTPVREALHLMLTKKRGACVIEEGGCITGILTEYDVLVQESKSGTQWLDLPLREAMWPNPVAVRAHESIAEALKLMKDGNFHHLPIIDETGHTTGIISVRDILAYVVEHFPGEFLNLPLDPSHEARGPWGG